MSAYETVWSNRGQAQVTQLETAKSGLCCAIAEIEIGDVDAALSFIEDVASELTDIADKLQKLQECNSHTTINCPTP